MPDRAHDEVSDVILQRVYGEFLEMPGMRLTPAQAQRLWGLDERTCLLLLDYLVGAPQMPLGQVSGRSTSWRDHSSIGSSARVSS
jgi:hypothetical protein